MIIQEKSNANAADAIPEVAKEQREADMLVTLVRKLRWMGPEVVPDHLRMRDFAGALYKQPLARAERQK
jgi:hypothetical protein